MKLIPEWYEHQYCLIAWPCNKDLYGKIINKARDEVANVINEIAKTEHVIVLSNKEDINEIQNKTDHKNIDIIECKFCLLYTSPSPRDLSTSRMPSSA